ncbi:Prolipoprotein diacylglyceryl transferase [Desulfatibacillum alkenivorans DSM 16219]|uniref:Prolipoprotein diacylglyceryl transferase n=1 Tax=Desulfatibacillum alkenivorans DSM 16219 TaxID=1121393 RepID=A0A1M6UW17_9BACT|nr:prolipoprotein diacylglyceryl transferase family protein [Desulfatibacillum alkenivorans]SHK73389.1 Prolipoprotein diacylglyceryl transferase [Desulfatibacillum alkenivorans DSM 16219]
MAQYADYIFVACLAAVLGAVLAWGFKTLPDASWQFVASAPKKRSADGKSWEAVNFTYYGLIIACSSAFSVTLAVFLLGAASVPVWSSLAVTLALMMICIPSSKILARIVEKKKHTFTVGGALFIGVLTMPWIVWGLKAAAGEGAGIQVLPVCAAMAVAYGFGEGLGRLACISFGCCYGKPFSQVHPVLQKLLNGKGFVFSGETKKISYASGLEGRKVFPIQALTAAIYCASALLSTLLFLRGHFGLALLQVLMVTQVWRFFSEMLRDDYRGEGKISAYQIMMIIAILYTALLPLVFPMGEALKPALALGWKAVWSPIVILAVQALWAALFVYYGKSTVTGGAISFHVMKDHI